MKYLFKKDRKSTRLNSSHFLFGAFLFRPYAGFGADLQE